MEPSRDTGEVVTQFKRRELKFLLDPATCTQIERELRRHMDVDPHGDADGCYPVVDLYFDNRYHDVYWDHARNNPSRQKLRIRVYGGAGAAVEPISFLELKRKQSGRVYKQRIVIAVEDALEVARGVPVGAGWKRNDRRFLAHVQQMARARELRPSCVLRYHRQALRGRGDESDLRVTFDRDLRFRIHDLVPRPDDAGCDRELAGTAVVMEVKVSERIPDWLARLIHAHGCVRQSHSKYARVFEAVFLSNGETADARRIWQANLA